MAMLSTFQLEQVRNLLDQAEPRHMFQNSYRDYHAKGLDYLCLHRSEGLTIKAYFLNVPQGMNIVNPHDHAYNFHTFILKGKLANLLYKEGEGEIWNKFHYRPSLSRNRRFVIDSSTKLKLVRDDQYCIGTGYYMVRDEIHTIQSLAPDTVMLLYQYQTPSAKKDEGTFLYTKEGNPPSTDSLYRTFSDVEMAERVKDLRKIVG